MNKFGIIIDTVREKKPLVHHITNYVTVNDCANITLAIGAAPVMADDIDEVAEIVSIASSLVINIGTLNKRTIESMVAAGKKANERGTPVILDPVGAGASVLRTETAARLIQEVKFAVIRGNVSEIKTLSKGTGSTRGVDANESDANADNYLDYTAQLAIDFAKKTGSVIAVTGVIDVISDGVKTYFIKNGHPMMAGVTGTGCMCTSLVGSCCGATEDHTEAAVSAVAAMGLAGEKAFKRVQEAGLGSGSFRSFIIDETSLLTGDMLQQGGKINLG